MRPAGLFSVLVSAGWLALGDTAVSQQPEARCRPTAEQGARIYDLFNRLRNQAPELWVKGPVPSIDRSLYRRIVIETVRQSAIEPSCRRDVSRRILVERRIDLNDIKGGAVIMDDNSGLSFTEMSAVTAKEGHVVGLLLDELRDQRPSPPWSWD